MKVVSSLAAIQALAVIVFLVKKWNHLKLDKKEFADVITDGGELEVMSMKNHMHKEERDIYLSTACLLAQALVYSICH